MENDSIEKLKAIVEKHTVRYEVWPHYDIHDGVRVTVGFDLELHGTHDHGYTRQSPGCSLCKETFEDLRQIAEWILPREERPSRYDVSIFDQSLHSSGNGPVEVVLPIRIAHKNDYFGPVDDCEQRCLKDMEQKLAELDVHGGRGVRTR